MRFEKLKVKRQKAKVQLKSQNFWALAIIVGLIVILVACGKQEGKRPASIEEPKPPAPFSRGPTGPPKISAPTYPQP